MLVSNQTTATEHKAWDESSKQNIYIEIQDLQMLFPIVTQSSYHIIISYIMMTLWCLKWITLKYTNQLLITILLFVNKAHNDV